MSAIFNVGDLIIGKTKLHKNRAGTVDRIYSIGNKRRFDIRWSNGVVSSVAVNAFRKRDELIVLGAPERRNGITSPTENHRRGGVGTAEDNASDDEASNSEMSSEDSSNDRSYCELFIALNLIYYTL